MWEYAIKKEKECAYNFRVIQPIAYIHYHKIYAQIFIEILWRLRPTTYTPRNQSLLGN